MVKCFCGNIANFPLLFMSHKQRLLPFWVAWWILVPPPTAVLENKKGYNYAIFDAIIPLTVLKSYRPPKVDKK